MDLSEIIDKAQDIISDASVAEQAGDLKEAYVQMGRLNDLLIEEFASLQCQE